MSNGEFWTPEYLEKPGEKISFDDAKLQTFSNAREVGVIVQNEEECTESALFQIGRDLLLRQNWRLWLSVSGDDSAVVDAICRRHRVKIMRIVNNCTTEYTIPVYRIDEKPVGLFKSLVPANEERESQKKRSGRNGTSPGYAEKTEENSGKLPLFRNLLRQLQRNGGKLLGVYDDGEAVSLLLIRIQTRIYLITVFADRQDWLADETCFNDEPPLWFSESSHRISPVYIAMKMSNYLLRESGVQTIPVVVLEDKVDILNAEEESPAWKTAEILLCYYQRKGEAPFKQSFLDLMTAEAAEEGKSSPPPSGMKQLVKLFRNLDVEKATEILKVE